MTIKDFIDHIQINLLHWTVVIQCLYYSINLQCRAPEWSLWSEFLHKSTKELKQEFDCLRGRILQTDKWTICINKGLNDSEQMSSGNYKFNKDRNHLEVPDHLFTSFGLTQTTDGYRSDQKKEHIYNLKVKTDED